MIELIALVVTVLGIVLSYPSIRKQWKDHVSQSGAKNLNSALSNVLERKTLKVGCIPYPPFINYQRTGKKHSIDEGYYKTLFDALGRENGLEIEYIPVRNDWSLDYLQSNKVDVIACLLRTPERIRKADFAITLHTVSMNGVSRSDDLRIQEKEHLRRDDVRVIAVEGESGQEALRDYGISKETSPLQLIETDDVSSIFKMVQAGLADVAISDGLACLEYMNSEEGEGCNLRLLFEENPLLVSACGLMIKAEEPDLKKWLFEEVTKAREIPAVLTAENALISEYGQVVHRI